MQRRMFWIVLVASLALNVFVVGAFVGAQVAQTPPPQSSDQGAARPARPRNPVLLAVRSLSPQSQAAWRRQSNDFAKDAGPGGRKARELARQTLGGFGAEPFDAEAALAGLARARALEHAHRTAMDRRLVAFAAGLPPDERARFAQALALAQRPPPRLD